MVAAERVAAGSRRAGARVGRVQVTEFDIVYECLVRVHCELDTCC